LLKPHRTHAFTFAILLLCAASLPVFAASSTYNRLYVFGDSYSDIGEGYLDGNGPTAVAYLAQHLGFPLLPANTPGPADRSLNFAISGAGTGRSAGTRIGAALLSVGMQNQVEDFAQRVRSRAVAFRPETTLFFLAGGLNDKRIPSNETVRNLESEIRSLYSLGARHVLVALLPVAIPDFSAVAQRLNPELARIPAQMQSELPDLHIALSHWGPFFDEVMRSPLEYGIYDTTDACAGRALFHQDPTPCSTPDRYFFYHAGHPSTAAHKIVGEKLYHEVLAFQAQSK
jgi:cholinesterase